MLTGNNLMSLLQRCSLIVMWPELHHLFFINFPLTALCCFFGLPAGTWKHKKKHTVRNVRIKQQFCDAHNAALLILLLELHQLCQFIHLVRKRADLSNNNYQYTWLIPAAWRLPNSLTNSSATAAIFSFQSKVVRGAWAPTAVHESRQWSCG